MTQAILTGDIIHSTRMNDNDRNLLFSQITNMLKQLDKDFNMKSETFQGDSFQSMLQKPTDALRVALIQKTFIKTLTPESPYRHLNFKKRMFDARIAIGIGSIESVQKRIAASNGEAFILSGRLLDRMKGKKQSIAITTNDTFNDELETESILLDAIISDTTALQCEVINLKLLGYTEVEIAKRLNIIQSAVNQRSIGGNWNAIEAAIKRFEKIY